jgi:hypothetical protein
MTIIARRNTSVATQQKSQQTPIKHSSLTPNQLHLETLDARDKFFKKCDGAEKYAINVLLPYCEEIIRRYKMQGVPAKDRPNCKPTVDAYFKSINLNYNTVRSWIYRKRLSTEIFQSKKSKSWNKSGNIAHLTQLESKLLGTAAAGHDLIKAIKNGGNIEDAIKDFEEHAPTLERIDDYIERPVEVVTPEIERLAIQLCKLIGDDAKQKPKIRALAGDLLVKLEPSTPNDDLPEQQKRTS